MKKILITGGSVHGKLDDVKMVTNRFKGGMMAELANMLSTHFRVIYLTAKGAKTPGCKNVEVQYHDGFYDYRERVLSLAKDVDGVVLGAAVANLIPQAPFVGKFPSHKYKVGDVIDIPFIVAPRVIDEVKKVAPNVRLFGFKLLSDVTNDELVSAAFGVLQEAKADFVFANDTRDLRQKFAVTREKSTIPLDLAGVASLIRDSLLGKFYSTQIVESLGENIPKELLLKGEALYKELLERYNDEFMKHNGLGSVAVRLDDHHFITTPRKKVFLDDKVVVMPVIVSVDLPKLIVKSKKWKATLNAPLFANIFYLNPKVNFVVHLHKQIYGLKTLDYEIPGSQDDSDRAEKTSFNVGYHGCYLFNGE